MIIHINSHIIRSNINSDVKLPPISVRKTRSGKVISRHFELDIKGPCKIIYNPNKPLPCGARVWIETTK